MDISKLKSNNIRAILSLISKREKVEKELEEINAKIATALGGSEGVGAKKKAGKKASAKPAKSRKSGTGRRRGKLTEDIVALLSTVGPEGLSSPEIAAKLNVPNQNIHVWFSTTGKKLAGLAKTEAKRLVYTPPQV